ncbi:MAG: triose-phosphate isomerase [Rhizomicrobium sp.]
MRQLIAGNWKMNGTARSLVEIDKVADWYATSPRGAECLICPPATLLTRAVAEAAGRLSIGGQDCRPEAAGAFTGDISAEMLKDAGAAAVIVGHSERRQFHGETSRLVAAKAMAAWRAGLIAIACVGETEAERQSGRALSVLAEQVAESVPSGATGVSTVIAYEPVWAIGTGRTPTAAEITEAHAYIRACCGRPDIRILYGGSVKPDNAAAILALPEVGGALVGGASLKAADFRVILEAAV